MYRQQDNRAEIELLARHHAKRKSQATLDALMESCMGYIRGISTKVSNPVQHMLSTDDLIQIGAVGLLGAIRTYKPDTGTNFRTYIYPRIRGAMLDGIRSMSPTSRTRNVEWTPIDDLHETSRNIDEVMEALAPEDMSNALAKALGLIHPANKALVLLILNGIKTKHLAYMFATTSVVITTQRKRALIELSGHMDGYLTETMEELL